MSRNRRSLLTGGVATAVAGLGAARFWPWNDAVPAPLSLPVLSSLQGSTISLDAAGQQGLLVSFWATTCAICVRDLPILSALSERWAERGIAVVAVAMAYDNAAMVRHFARLNPRLPPIVLDTQGAVAAALGPIRETPTHCLLDRQGRRLWREQGPLKAPDLEVRMRALISGRADSA